MGLDFSRVKPSVMTLRIELYLLTYCYDSHTHVIPSPQSHMSIEVFLAFASTSIKKI